MLADAVTALVALLGGKYLGQSRLDRLVGPALVARWSWGLMRQSSAVLLDHRRPSSSGNHGAGFLQRLDDAVTKATALEETVVGHASPETFDARFALVRTSCTECHRTATDVDAGSS